MELLIQATGLRRRYGPHLAVDGLDIELKRGDILGFLGPNGAGKSTSMRMLTGNLAPHQGQVRINGIDLQQAPLEAKRHLGYLPETPPLYRELRVDEYLLYAARLHGLDRQASVRALDKAKQRCGLTHVGQRLIANLSKGYQQRVGIAQAIIHEPLVVVLDEPTVGLDPNQIREIRSLIRELGQSHSVILSTHILPEVQSLCNRVQIINQGRTLYAASLGDKADSEEHREPTQASIQASTQLQLCLERPPQVENQAQALLKLGMVAAVEPLKDGCFDIRLHENQSPATLAEAVVKAGFGLKALIPRERSLEQIFVELTSGEADRQ